MICRKGEFELDLCIVLSGRAEVHDDDDAGVETRTVYRAGSIFGELGAMGGRPRSFDVVATEETQILYIPRHALKYLEINEKARNDPCAALPRAGGPRDDRQNRAVCHGVPESFIDELIPHCRIHALRPARRAGRAAGRGGRRLLHHP